MTTRWIPTLLMVAMGLPLGVRAQSQLQGRFQISAHQVAQTLTANGVQTLDEQVLLLAKVVASEPSPVLDILSVEPLGNRPPGQHSELRSLVKLGCHMPGTCLPFYSIVTKPESQADSPSRVPGFSAVTGNAALKPNAGIVIRAGAHATLVMDDARSHVEVAVITLENGIAGHRIHVASPDHKQVYVAEVVSANLLRRSF
ncbi:MAG: hypothetical protein ABSC76_04720 [Terracidiphilus sp.]|jgi:hypothetical protein